MIFNWLIKISLKNEKKKSNKAFFILVNITNINLTHQFSFIEMVYKINMAKKLLFL